MQLRQFRDKIRYYRRLSEKSQEALAAAIGIYPTVLSERLNGAKNAQLTYSDIKTIILTLARWESLTRRDEVTELLELLDLSTTFFSPPEWAAPPLSQLSDAPIKALAKPEPTPISAPEIVEEPPPLHNLPAQTTPLIGRTHELETAVHILRRADVRLLSLLGPGGVGKTRLGLGVAASLAEDFQDGVTLVELAALSDYRQVLTTLTQKLGVKGGSPSQLLAGLKKYLANKHKLLFLDNFEHVIEASGLVEELLTAAPRLKILVTSRTVLSLYGEYQFSVPPLGLPVAQEVRRGQLGLEALANYEAVQLFIQRARAVRTDFALTAENALPVAEICLLLEGLPLAVELAAAQSRLFAPASLLQRLLGRQQVAAGAQVQLGVLAGGPSNRPIRQQTLRNTLDWSYSLLSPPDRQLFEQLAVFVGETSVKAVEQVCETGASTLEQLNHLLDHSIVRLEEKNDELYVNLLVSLRDYALEKLAAQPAKMATLKARHAHYYYQLAVEIGAKFSGPQQANSFARLEREYFNLQAALSWWLNDQPAEDNGSGLEMVENLWWFWYVRGYFVEGQRWLSLALASKEVASPDLQAKLFNGAGAIAVAQSQFAKARQNYEAALAIKRLLNDRIGLASVLNNLGGLATEQGDYTAARPLHEEALAIRREVGQPQAIAVSLNNLSMTMHRLGDLTTAHSLQEEALSLKRALGDQQGTAWTLGNLANLYRAQNDFGQSRALHTESLELHRELGNKRGMASSLGSIGYLAALERDYNRAKSLMQEALAIQREIDQKRDMIESLNNLGEVATLEGDWRTAQTYYREALELSQLIGYGPGEAIAQTALEKIGPAPLQSYNQKDEAQQGQSANLHN